MTCDEARALFSARADDAITPDEVTRLDTHLSGCAECRAEWARFARTTSLVRGIEPARAPAGFVDRVLEAARPEPWPLRLVRHVFMPMRVKLPVEAAAVMLIAGLAVVIFQRSPEMQRGARFEQPTPPPQAAPPSEAPAVASRDVSPSAPSPAPPPASSEARAAKPDEAPLADRAARPDAASAPEPAAPPPANVAQQAERGAGESARREAAAKSTAAPATAAAPPTAGAPPTAAAPPTRAPLAARARPHAEVTAQLSVRDRGAALTALASLATRLGGSELARREESGAHVVELAIPRDAYETFTREASQLGTFTSQRHRADPQSSIHISIRVE